MAYWQLHSDTTLSDLTNPYGPLTGQPDRSTQRRRTPLPSLPLRAPLQHQAGSCVHGICGRADGNGGGGGGGGAVAGHFYRAQRAADQRGDSGASRTMGGHRGAGGHGEAPSHRCTVHSRLRSACTGTARRCRPVPIAADRSELQGPVSGRHAVPPALRPSAAMDSMSLTGGERRNVSSPRLQSGDQITDMATPPCVRRPYASGSIPVINAPAPPSTARHCPAPSGTA